jgi:hypothetical protein
MWDLAKRLDPPSSIASMWDLAKRLDPPSSIASMWDLAKPFAPTATNPAALPPEPPSSNPRITWPLCILQRLPNPIALSHQPDVSRPKIDVAHGVIGLASYLSGLIFRCTPKISQKPVDVVHHL